MAYDSDVTEMVEVHLFQTMGNVRCTITSQRYALLLRQYVIPALKARRCDETTVFMQDGALKFIARCVKELLHLHFGDERIISR